MSTPRARRPCWSVQMTVAAVVRLQRADGDSTTRARHRRRHRLTTLLLFGDQHQLPLRLVASILEPDFHLRLGESQRLRQLGALRSRQVSLPVETTLQLEHLHADISNHATSSHSSEGVIFSPLFYAFVPRQCRRMHYVFGLPVRRVHPSVRPFLRTFVRTRYHDVS